MTTTAIVPVYNEEKTVGNVLKILTNSKYIDKVIVLNDGSTDNSASIIKTFNVKLINFKKNQGKGTVIYKGIKRIRSDTVLIFDADLIGLRQYHIKKLVEPVLKDKVDMSVGIINNPSNRLLNFTYRMSRLSGQRVMRSEHFNRIIKNPLIKGWGIESVVNYYFKKNKLKRKNFKLKRVTHISKIEKGGISSLIKEMQEVLKTRAQLRKNEPPK